MIDDTSKHNIASELEVTSQLGIKSFLGVPIVLKNGEMYGTLCAISTSYYSFKQKDIDLLYSMASFLAYFIELEHTENLYRQLVEKSPDGIIVEKEGELVYANPATFTLLNKPKNNDLTGEKLSNLLINEDSPRFPNKSKDREKTSLFEEKRLIQDSGEHLSVETIKEPLCYKGEPATQIMVRDISYRKYIEEMIKQSEKLSLAGQLAASVAHEIRNPLTGIKGFIQLLKASATENHSYYDIIMSEVEKIREIVNEFLYLAKPEIPVVTQYNLVSLLHEVIVLLQAQATAQRITIRTTYSPNLPSVLCESNQIKQVLMNIIKNAIEVMTEGGQIQIHVGQENEMVKATVSDEGRGIPKERLERLGEPFYTTKEKGTGLGLMVAKKIIQEHRGELLFESVINRGTKVTMLLPIK
ncbi:ATP-binding protein [Alkalihalobacterium bogoriense]|uniref:ATP-binding protein n=1 Tax=Alkalihalobacterium bogoriense TaxID=246272 RepID=UPI00247FC47C|nr:ATP-binding protein [Alkalihalobacterium bogoriense]